MIYMIFQYDFEPVLNQRILIGFEAILEINYLFVVYISSKKEKKILKTKNNKHSFNVVDCGHIRLRVGVKGCFCLPLSGVEKYHFLPSKF